MLLINKLCINKKTGRVIRGIIPVHVFGHPMKIDKLVSLAKKFKLFVLEDSAEALGSKFKRKHTGTFGNIGVLSFNGNKIVTTGTGGAILTNNKKLALQKKIFYRNSLSSNKSLITGLYRPSCCSRLSGNARSCKRKK